MYDKEKRINRNDGIFQLLIKFYISKFYITLLIK